MTAANAAALLTLAAVAAATGCASAPTTTYAWVGYQDSLYRMYVQSGDFDPAAEAHRLSIEIEEALQNRRTVAPGVRAHLGFLCAASGDPAGAVAHLEAEKAAFPESAVFVDGMLRRMSK